MDLVVPVDLLTPRRPAEGETYLAYLSSFGLLSHGFEFGELVRAGPRHMPPPMRLWSAMVPTLALAIELRRRMVAAGVRGLAIAAAYRPQGGAADSRHKHNGALDLDLLPGDERMQLQYPKIAAELWLEHAHLRAGAGTYAPDGRRWSARIHLDTGYRFRCWQGLPGGGWSAHPAILELAQAEDDEQLVARADEQAPVDPPDRDCTRQGATWPG